MRTSNSALTLERTGARPSGRERISVRHLLRSERGAVLVEFGIVAPFMALLTCAIMDFSLAMFTLNNLTIAVREGGRIAAVMPVVAKDDPAVVNRVKQSLALQFKNTPANYKISVTTENATGTPIGNITVRIEDFYYVPVTPMASLFGMGTVNMNRAVVFRSELSNPPGT